MAYLRILLCFVLRFIELQKLLEFKKLMVLFNFRRLFTCVEMFEANTFEIKRNSAVWTNTINTVEQLSQSSSNCTQIRQWIWIQMIRRLTLTFSVRPVCDHAMSELTNPVALAKNEQCQLREAGKFRTTNTTASNNQNGNRKSTKSTTTKSRRIVRSNVFMRSEWSGPRKMYTAKKRRLSTLVSTTKQRT